MSRFWGKQNTVQSTRLNDEHKNGNILQIYTPKTLSNQCPQNTQLFLKIKQEKLKQFL